MKTYKTIRVFLVSCRHCNATLAIDNVNDLISMYSLPSFEHRQGSADCPFWVAKCCVCNLPTDFGASRDKIEQLTK